MKEEVPDAALGTDDLAEWREGLRISPEQLSALLETLRKIAEKATEGVPVDMKLLRSEIEDAVQWYEIDPWAEAEAKKMNLHEIGGPVRVILAALRNDANDGIMFAALGDGDFFEGIRRRDSLIADLERLRERAAKHMPRKGPNHRPAGTNLRRLVGHLANGWSLVTNSHFSSDWIGEQPATSGVQFVHEVVKVLDPSSLSQLRTATRWVVKARKDGKLPGYFNDRSRKDAI